MKSTFKRIVSALLVFSLLVCSLSSCALFNEYEDDVRDDGVREDDVHVHEFSDQYNDTDHYKICSCGETVDVASHILNWVTDLEPTTEAPGYKHIECDICGYKAEENTEIEKLPDENTNTAPQKETKQFYELSEFLEYYENNKFRSDKSIPCFRIDFEKDNSDLFLHMQAYAYYFFYCYKTTDGKLTNIKLCVDFDIAKVERESNGGKTIRFAMEFYEFDDTNDEYTLVFYEHAFEYDTLDYSVFIFQNDVCIGKIFYSCRDWATNKYCEADRKWMENFIRQNLIILRFDTEA